MIHLLAQAAATSQPAQQQPDFLHNIFGIPMLLMLGVIWIMLVILPKRKQDKNRQNMLKEMKRGDEVRTIGGIIGKIVEARDDRVLLKVDESSNAKIWFDRSAIARVTAEDAKDAKAVK